MTTVLVIDDSDVDREQIRRLLGGRHELLEAATAREGMAAVSSSTVDCVLLDYRLPDEDGVRVLDLMSERSLPVVMLTSQGSEKVAVEALKHGAMDYLLKGDLNRERLRKAIDLAIEQGRLRNELDRHQRELQQAVTQLREQRNELAAMNEALQRRETDLRFVLGQLPVVHWTTDMGLKITHIGGAALEAMGVPAASRIGRDVGDNFGDEATGKEFHAAHAPALEGEPVRYLANFGGRPYQCHIGALRDAEGAIVGTIGLALDVSEARELEQQLRHAVKMDALGQLAGGIAHDFNNLLSVILGFAGFIRAGLPSEAPMQQDLGQVIDAANRAAALVRQLLSFSRLSTGTPRVVEARAVIASTLPMLERLVGEDIAVTLTPDAEPWRVRIDPNALEQMVVNLVVNARDAMTRGGRIEIEIQHLSLVEELAGGGDRRLAPGDYVVLCVTDEGEGIPRDVLERIFDPFFTTKEVGRGTGLGLSTVYGIARQVGGTVTVYSEVGHGSSFRVFLPRALEQVDAPRAAPSPVPQGTETVLVVEDEEPVREVAVRALRSLGYTVLEASDGPAAVARCRDYAGGIDLVLTDVVMPGMSGPEVARSLLALRPSLRVLYMSGYTDRGARERGRLPQGARLIEKPITADRLGRSVRAALDE
ncbi:MAG: response regulator [Myxococcaceae bacterium]|nr:MAG: response regulator [Myxococcaceae bacterium]